MEIIIAHPLDKLWMLPYVIRENLQLLRDKLMKRRKIRYGDKHIKFAIIDALCDMHKIIMKNLVEFEY